MRPSLVVPLDTKYGDSSWSLAALLKQQYPSIEYTQLVRTSSMRSDIMRVRDHDAIIGRWSLPC